MTFLERLIPAFLAAALSPLLLGLVVRTKSCIAGRRGAPLLQPYWDLAKLLRKGEVRSSTSTSIFGLGPALTLASLFLATLLLPMGPLAPAISFQGDLVLLAYLLALGRFSTISSAMDTGSSFEGMGASREGVFSALAEPALFLVLGGMAWSRGNLSLAVCLGGVTGGLPAVALPAYALLTVALFMILLSENCRLPVDDPATHLELTMVHEVMVLDHSGPTFSLVQYGAALKMWLFSVLLVSPWIPAGIGGPGAAGLMLAGIALAGVSVGLTESLTARLRLDRVPRFLGLASVLAALGILVLLTGGRP